MINTIVSGFLKISIHILDFFLEPIENLLDSAGLGDNLSSFTNAFAGLMQVLRGVLPWVIDATGLPKPLFRLMFGVFIACMSLRLSIFIVKMVLKWWDRVVA